VHVETVRYYQRRGLLREPARPLNGIRRYGVADVSRLRFIKHAQQSGFTLDEVRALLRLSGSPACGASRALAAKKLAAMEEKRCGCWLGCDGNYGSGLLRAMLIPGTIARRWRSSRTDRAGLPCAIRAQPDIGYQLNGIVIPRPSLRALQHPSKVQAIVFFAFDLLYLNGRDLTPLSLEKRRAKLPVVAEDSGLQLSLELPGSAAQVIAAVRALELEGVVAKRTDSPYVGSQKEWTPGFSKSFPPGPAAGDVFSVL
jgi:hypothetical protein